MSEMRLGELLLADGLLTEEQFSEALESQKQTPSVPIGQIICQLGFLTTEELNLALDFNKKRLKLGDILIQQKLIDEIKLEKALELSKKERIQLGKALLRLLYIQEDQLAKAIAVQYDLQYVSLDKYVVNESVGKLFSSSYSIRHRLVAIEKSATQVTIAIAYPLSPQIQHELEVLINLTIKPVIAKESEILSTLENVYGIKRTNTAVHQEDQVKLDILEDFSADNKRSNYILDYNVDYLTKKLISVGARAGASDIHLEHTERGTVVRFRIDGVLQSLDLGGDSQQILTYGKPLVSKIKILCDLDITEKRRPQNGSFRVKMSLDNITKSIDFRVSTLPTKYGENVVIRILDRIGQMSLQSLGFSPSITKELKQLLTKPTGIFLVTGPTGSGKSSTLYAILNKLNQPGVKTLTVEDPIEYIMEGISQSEVNTAIGNTFAEHLRAFLRQDPDHIMVGEIRDVETALISIRASLTGHTVLSTLHTNDSTSVVQRLVDMGVEPTLLSATLRCIISQRLIRMLCEHCSEEKAPNQEILAEFGISPDPSHKFMAGKGCHHCNNTGFIGRKPIVEMWVPSREEALLINKHASNLAIRESAFNNCNRPTMVEDGLQKVFSGKTTLEELARVVPYEQVIEYRNKLKMGMMPQSSSRHDRDVEEFAISPGRSFPATFESP